MTADRFNLHLGDCRESMALMDPASVHAIVTDPPYGVDIMGKGWDTGVPGVDFWTAALRVAKPGAHLLAFGGTRMFHRMTVAIEDAGWEIRDCLMWVYGSGFPKSMDVSKAIDRGFRRDETGADYVWSPSSGPTGDVYAVTAFIRAARDAAGKTNREIDELFGFNGMAGHWVTAASQPAVPTWPQWEQLRAFLGFGTELDELAIRINGGKGDRSIEGTAMAERAITGHHDNAAPGQSWNANNGMSHDLTAKEMRDEPATAAARHWRGWGTALKPAWEPIIMARRPFPGTVASNVMLHGTGAVNVDACRIASDDAEGRWPANLIHDDSEGVRLRFPVDGGETACRFFYSAKASRDDRNDGIAAGKNTHPTVKPTDLMRYLCRMITPPGGTVLDPFMGSGSTGRAAILEGFNFEGCEREAEYFELSRARIAAALKAQSQTPPLIREDGQLSIFGSELEATA